MEEILKDKFFSQCRTAIQNYIDYKGFDDGSREKLVTLYTELTPQNAKDSLAVVNEMYETATDSVVRIVATNKIGRAFKYGGGLFIASVICGVGSYMIDKIWPNKTLEIITGGSVFGGVLGLAVAFVLMPH